MIRFWEKRHIGVVLGLLLILMVLSNPHDIAQAADSDGATGQGRVVTVAFPIVEGLTEIDDSGQRVGLVVDYLEEIAKYTGWTYEYIEVDGEKLIPQFLEGEFDLMGGTYYDPSFEQYFAYPQYNSGYSKATLICLKDNHELKSYDLNTLNNKKIGVYAQAKEKIRRLKVFLQSNGLDCELVYYQYGDMKDGTLYQYLMDGEVDILMGNDLEQVDQFRIVTSFEAQPYYIVTTLDNSEILADLNMAMERILDADPNFAQEHYEKYFSLINATSIELSNEELAYIAEKEMLTVAAVRDWHPFYCSYDSQEHHRGLVYEMFDKISDFSGLEFSYVYADSYDGAIKLVQEGKADILGCYVDAENVAKTQSIVLTKPYTQMNNIILKNKRASYPDDGLIGATISGRVLPSNVTAEEVRYFEESQEGLQAVNRGEVDFVYDLAVSLEFDMQGQHFNNVVPMALVNNNTDVALGLSKPARPELLTILNKSINSISAQDMEAILNRSLVSIGYSTVTLKDWVYSNPISVIIVITVILLLLLMVFLIITRIKIKNSLMENELKKMEAESRAKGEFLSRMSHEIRTPMNAIVGLTELTCVQQEAPPAIVENLHKIRSSSQYLLSLINDILDMSRIESGMMEINTTSFSLRQMLVALEEMMQIQVEQRQVRFYSTQQIEHDYLIGDPIRLRQVLINLLTNAFKFTEAGGEISLNVIEVGADEESAVYTFSVEDTGIGIPEEARKRIFGAFEQVGPNISKSEGTGLGLAISYNIVQLMGGELEVTSELGKGSRFYFSLRLPIAEAAQEVQPVDMVPTVPKLRGIRILLVEDNELNAEIASELLKLQEAKVEWAINGQAAVDLFLSHEPGYYQLILMDIKMPVKDGLQAAREIRQSDHADAQFVPIIAMTANSFKEDVEAAVDVGMNGFVPKPVDMNYLYEILQQNLGTQQH